MSRRNPRTLPDRAALAENAPRPAVTVIAAAWLIVFCVYFFSSELPNGPLLQNGAGRYSRPMLLAYLPDYFIDYVTAEPLPGEPPSGWRFLPQRFDLMAVAALILAGAYSAGSLALRLLGIALPGRPAERTVFAAGLGLSAVSLATLLLGLGGMLSLPLFLVLLFGACAAEAAVRFRGRHGNPSAAPQLLGPGAPGEQADAPLSPRFRLVCLAGMAPFVLAMLLGAMQPETDFDVREYHLQGPKESFLAGRITFLPHNVYTSFPFLTEMLSLAGMVVGGDWFRGALAGKVVLMSFAPLTGLAAYAAARRCFGPAAGWFAALISLSTPWTYRVSIIAYAEGGLAFFLAASVLAAIAAWDELRAGRPAGRFVLLTGLLAGSAMACKYPGLVSVVIPLGIALGAAAWKRRDPEAAADPSAKKPASQEARSRLLHTAAVYSAGVLIAVGPWLLKNLVETGNPVYPLLYSVFGGRDIDPELAAKFHAGHRPDDYDLTKLWFWITDLSARNDWLSPLLYGFAPLAFLQRKRIGAVAGLWLFVGYLFWQWWLFTHRLDRFWVPMLPVVAVLAGAGAAAMPARWLRNAVIAFCLLFNLEYVTSALAGPNNYLADLDALRRQKTSRSMAALNELPPGSKVLCVGEAEVFDATTPVVYNTVFDRSIFQEWFAEPRAGTPAGDLPLRDPAVIRETLREHGITHIYVNWGEILRYRASYGYTDFVTPERFSQLVAEGVLARPTTVAVAPLSTSPRDRRELDEWGKALQRPGADPPVWIAAELYPVAR